MTASRSFDLRDMTARDLPAALALSQLVNWPHRLEDWQLAHSVGQGLVAVSDDRIVGTAMWWSCDGRIARLGMVIVDPTLQRSGIGHALMQSILDRITASTVMLNATQQGEPLYRRLDFQDTGSIVQHQSAAFSAPTAPLRAGMRVRPLDRDDRPRLVDLDALAGGARRENVIAALIETGDAIVLEDAGTVVGFAVCRRFGRGHLIGPVVARNAVDAKALIAHWIGLRAAAFLRIDVPGDCGLSSWLEQAGLARVDEVVTMVRGARPKQNDQFRVFGIVNQALG